MALKDEIQKNIKEKNEKIEKQRSQYSQYVKDACNSLYEEIKKGIIWNATNNEVTEYKTGFFSTETFYEGYALLHFSAATECYYFLDYLDGDCCLSGTDTFLKDVLSGLIKLFQKENVSLTIESFTGSRYEAKVISLHELNFSNIEKITRRCFIKSNNQSTSLTLKVKGRLSIYDLTD